MRNNGAKKVPRLLEEGLQAVAEMGCQSIYEDMVEEYAEKLKQDFISQLKDRLQEQVQVTSHLAFNDRDFEVKIEVVLKGVD